MKIVEIDIYPTESLLNRLVGLEGKILIYARHKRDCSDSVDVSYHVIKDVPITTFKVCCDSKVVYWTSSGLCEIPVDRWKTETKLMAEFLPIRLETDMTQHTIAYKFIEHALEVAPRDKLVAFLRWARETTPPTVQQAINYLNPKAV